MNLHRIREKLRGGEPTIGCFMSLGSPAVAELLGHSGFEWLVIETEHSGLDGAQVEELVRAVETTAAVPFVRVPSTDRVAIQRALDIGARGIVVPLVRTVEEAAAIVDATRYPPEGTRSFGPLRAARYGMDNEAYLEQANGQIVVILILETREAVGSLAEIAAVPGIDGLYVGPFDLSLSLGFDPLRADAPELEMVIEEAHRVCRDAGVALGVPVRSPVEVARRLGQGFGLLGLGPDYLLLADAACSGLQAFETATSPQPDDPDRLRRMVRFSINLSLLFVEVPFLERFDQAARAGFDAVEFWWPSGVSLPELAAAAQGAGVEVAMFNFDGGDMAAGERGYLNDPGREGLFREHVPVALELAAQLRCDRINALVGVARQGEAVADQLSRSRDNVAWASQQAAASGVTVLVEALNTFENGRYLLTSTAAAAAFVDSIEQPNVKLQYDAYHMQRMEGNLSANLVEHVDRIGHIQIADSPRRSEPGTGEINFDHVLGVIESSGYDGWVGLEYRPSTGSTEASLDWLPPERRGYGRVEETSR